jgi:hypothetical protein
MQHAHRFLLALVLGPAFLIPGPGPAAGTLSRDFSYCSKTCVAEQEACDLSCSELCAEASAGDYAALLSCDETCKVICDEFQGECLLKCRVARSPGDPVEP